MLQKLFIKQKLQLTVQVYEQNIIKLGLFDTK